MPEICRYDLHECHECRNCTESEIAEHFWNERFRKTKWSQRGPQDWTVENMEEHGGTWKCLN